MSKVWECLACGNSLTWSDPRWRFNGEIPQHKCQDPRAGYFDAIEVEYEEGLLADQIGIADTLPGAWSPED